VLLSKTGQSLEQRRALAGRTVGAAAMVCSVNDWQNNLSRPRLTKNDYLPFPNCRSQYAPTDQQTDSVIPDHTDKQPVDKAAHNQ
jgi:hypothetical protein